MHSIAVVRAGNQGTASWMRHRTVLAVALRFGIAFGTAMILVPVSSAQQVSATTVAFPDTGFVTEQVIADGRAIFRGHGGCIICHGMDLKGGIGPTLLAHPWKDAKNGTLTEIFRVVTTGVPGTSMLARPNGISDEQARRVSSYVWAASRHRAPP